MPRAFSAMTSLRPTVNPAKLRLRTARRMADFFRLVIEPAGARRGSRRGSVLGSRRVSFSVIEQMTYLRDLKILMARTFFMIRRRCALSAFESVGFLDGFFLMFSVHILSDGCQSIPLSAEIKLKDEVCQL